MKEGLVVANEARHFLKRDLRKNWKIVAGLYLLSTQRGEAGRAARSGYFFLRHIDDVIDGDRRIHGDPLNYVSELRGQVASGIYTRTSRVSLLARKSIELLEKIKEPNDNPSQDFLDGIDGIIFDYNRKTSRCVMGEEELESYYQMAISPGLNLLLTGIRSPIRAKDIPEFSSGLAKVYSVRDFRSDWEKGIINLPDTVLIDAGLSPDSIIEKVISNPLIIEWLKASLDKGKQELAQLQLKQKLNSDELTARILNGFIRSARKVKFEPPNS